MGDGGKGSRPRPFSVSQEEFDNRWENIFGKKNKEQETINEVSKLIADETLDNTDVKSKNTSKNLTDNK